MNLILLTETDFTAPGLVRLQDRRFHHIIKVHRAVPGDTLCVGLINAGTGTGQVVSVSASSIEMAVTLDTQPPPPLPLTLVMALPRPKMLRRIIQSVTSLGVKKLYLIHSWRVEKSFWSSPVLEPHSLEAELILGLEQARDTLLPEIHLRKRFKPFVMDELPGIARGTLALTAHPGTSPRCPTGLQQPVTLAMGPEGGFIEYEVTALETCGFQTVSLGPRILRLETAVPFILARLFG